MALKNKMTWAAVAGLVVVAASGWWWQNRAPSASAAADATAAVRPGGGAPGVGGPGGAPGGAGGPGGLRGAGGPGGPPAVEVGTVQTMTLVDDVSAVGSLRARQSVMLRPEVSGRIAQLGFRDGERVRRGQLLVQLDNTLQRAQLQQAQAQSSIAQTNLARSRELLGQGFISQSAVDQNAAALEVAQSQVALAQAQLARMAVLAPFDGITGIRLVNIGDYLKDGADIVTVDDLSSVLVDFRLPERYLPQLKAGLAIELALDALPGREYKGRIEVLDAQVDANGRSLLARARVDNPSGELKPGMFARPRVVFGRREQALVVPEEALVPQGAKQFIYLVVDGDDGKKAAKRVEARIGMRLPGKVELLGGAKPGDQVVTAGQSRLRGESMPVRVVDLSKPPGGPGRSPGAAGAGGAGDKPGPGTKPGGPGASGAAGAKPQV